MNQDDFKKILEDALDPINKQLNDPDTGLAAINRRLDSNTAAVMKLETTVKGYGDMYKINEDHIRRLDKRLDTVEDNLGIQPSEELTIPTA